MHLPLIIGYGGINSAGLSSTDQGYRNMVFSALAPAQRDALVRSLKALSGNGGAAPTARQRCFIRKINKDVFFDPAATPYYRVDNKRQPFPISFAAGLATDFDPGSSYNARAHPRGLQMAVFAASDAINATGLDPEQIRQQVPPERLAVYAGSALGQLDDHAMGGVLTSALKQLKTVTKQLPFSYPQMAADFINAYILKNMGITGNNCGACATFLYNLAAATEGIKNGQIDLALVGASEAPILPSILVAFYNMGAMVGDVELRGRDIAKASMPFGNNNGFVMGESAQFVVLASEEVVHRTGAIIHGMINDVFVSADGMKRSISAPGPGNYVTMGRALAALEARHGEDILRDKSYVLAHGTSTPQNRVTESHILSSMAQAFNIPNWQVVAIKSFIGHSQAAAGGDQLVTALAFWRYGILPGISTVETIAADVHGQNLSFNLKPLPLGVEGMEAALINAKGFGGNNATAVVSSPRLARALYRDRLGVKKLNAGRIKYERTQQAALDYCQRAEEGKWKVYYDFVDNPATEASIRVTRQQVTVGNQPPILLKP